MSAHGSPNYVSGNVLPATSRPPKLQV